MKKWKVEFTGQNWNFETYDAARAKVRLLLDAGVWWIPLTTFEPPPPVLPPVKPKARKKT